MPVLTPPGFGETGLTAHKIIQGSDLKSGVSRLSAALFWVETTVMTRKSTMDHARRAQNAPA